MKKILGYLGMGFGGLGMFSILVGSGIGFGGFIASAIVFGLSKKVVDSGKLDSIPKLIRKKGYMNEKDLATLLNIDYDSDDKRGIKRRALKSDIMITKNKCLIDNKIVRDTIKSIHSEIEQTGMVMASKVSGLIGMPVDIIEEVIESTPSFNNYKKYSMNGDSLLATGDYINNINVMLASRIYDIVQRRPHISRMEIVSGVLPSSIEKFLLDESIEYLRVNGLINIRADESEADNKKNTYTINQLPEGRSMINIFDALRGNSTRYSTEETH